MDTENNPPNPQRQMTEQEKQLRAFIGSHVKYDSEGTMIWGCDGDKIQLLADVRGWGAIQNLPQFKKDKDDKNAMLFQDALGQFIVDAINEKLKTTTP